MSTLYYKVCNKVILAYTILVEQASFYRHINVYKALCEMYST